MKFRDILGRVLTAIFSRGFWRCEEWADETVLANWSDEGSQPWSVPGRNITSTEWQTEEADDVHPNDPDTVGEWERNPVWDHVPR